ncbi:hypothetical protein JCGZ_19932 [Jatropha curcas]|uniref:Uncharacterized protein n=1 Tax=Jatropha curcas TaxID=180498 RepID=A0A067JWT9_JATCU|nr:hypothetical protein JCGZ_19932 [Jatropha curcas]
MLESGSMNDLAQAVLCNTLREVFVARACAIARLGRARLCPSKITFIMGVLGKHALRFLWARACCLACRGRASP